MHRFVLNFLWTETWCCDGLMYLNQLAKGSFLQIRKDNNRWKRLFNPDVLSDIAGWNALALPIKFRESSSVSSIM